jgi:hypothetical protein
MDHLATASIVPINNALKISGVNYKLLNPGCIDSMRLEFPTTPDLTKFTVEWINQGALYRETKLEGLIFEIFINN